MPHVQIDPPRIRQEAAVSRGFVVPAMMHIQHALTLDIENMISNLVSEPGGRMVRTIVMNEKTVLGLQAEDAVQHGVTAVRG